MNAVRETTEGIFRFRIDKQKAVLTSAEIRVGRIAVPAEVEGVPVVEIEKKAFFGQRNLKSICLPSSISAVGDWAFASCRNLEEVEFLGEQAALGKLVFQNCPKLLRIGRKGVHEDIVWLLGAVPKFMPELYLMNMEEAGSKNWLERWDAGLVRRIRESDEEGFADQFMCGLENFGQQDNDSYKEERRREKSELSYLRLLHPYGLSDNLRMRIRRYLLRHAKGCVSEAAWKVLLENHGTDMDYVRTYRDVFEDETITEVTPEQRRFDLDAHLKDVGDDYPELKAYLIRENEPCTVAEGFFDALSLDF